MEFQVLQQLVHQEGLLGGGSVNIFYNGVINDSNENYANGGDGVNYGGAGGAGTVTKGNISSGTFVQQ